MSHAISWVRNLITCSLVLAGSAALAQAPSVPSSPVPEQTPTKPPALPTTPVPQTLPTERPSMRFEWMREGPADACGDRCREWISASGQIVATTARLFADFARGRDVRGAVIVMESPGGHVGA